MISLKKILAEQLQETGTFIITKSDLLTEGQMGTFDIGVVHKLGGKDITQESVDRITEFKPGSLVSGGGNTYAPGKKEWSLQDLKSALTKEGQLVITTAASVTKVRTQYGERVCQLNKSGVNQNTDKHLSRVLTLLNLLQLGVNTVPKMAPGIGYETMQVDNLEKWVNENLGKKAKPLPLIINGKDSGVKINGAAKVTGVPKSDLAFGIDGKANFFISYKHGAMYDMTGNELKSAFQQYGSVSSFYNPKFTKQVDSVKGLKPVIEKFISATANKVKKSSESFKNVTGIKKQNKKWVLISNGKDVTPKDQNDTVWGSWYDRINKLSKPIKNLYVTPEKFSARRSILNTGQIGKDIAMMSIFGNNYFTGAPGVDNCNILMQDNAAFKIGKKVDKEGSAVGIEMNVSSAGHILWNPKMYGKKAEFPSFSKQYEPYLIARYTGANGWELKDDLIIGVRFLVMPESQTRSGSDI